jgi:SHAQKYF class myb-like DNA-binding protein
MTDYTSGRWTREEHHTFIKGLEMYGKGWKKIASLIKTRTVVQIRTHAQKYFLKLTKARQSGDANVSTDGKASGTGGRKVR